MGHIFHFNYDVLEAQMFLTMGSPIYLFFILLTTPAMQETRVRSLAWEDPLEKEMAIHSNTLA